MNIKLTEMNDDEIKFMISEESTDREYHKLSAKDIAPILRYWKNRIRPGDFLTAVISNDLREASGRADVRNRRRLFEYVDYLYNFVPSICWGSKEKFENWIKQRNDSEHE